MYNYIIVHRRATLQFTYIRKFSVKQGKRYKQRKSELSYIDQLCTLRRSTLVVAMNFEYLIV